MQVWKWLLLISVASIFLQIVLAGLMFLGVTMFHTTWGHVIFIPVVATLVAAWRQKAGRRMLYLLALILVVDLIQAEPLAHLASLQLSTSNYTTMAHGINVLILYTLGLGAAIMAVRDRRGPTAMPAKQP